MKQKLDRTLGLYSSLTISIGTMIGSAIFVLAGTSFEAAGPSASLSILLAGIAALFTAFSFAELVTFIPTAGGGYAYVRDATDNGVLGFICGWGFWLGYAMSCGLFALGFGTFLNYFFPFIPQLVGSYALILYVLYSNIKGVKGSSKLQNIITTGLILLLLGYIFYGVFFVDMSNQTPYFPKELGGTFKAMGFLYMTYIGYGLITTASEEVIEPEKTIPRAIMISIGAVIFIKTAVFFVGAGIKNWESLVTSATNTPMIDTAIEIGGAAGGYLFAFAGILATLSSINTAVLASSRTSFALSRDRRFPALFKSINKHTKTPIYSIVVTGIIVFIATTMRDLEHISTITSIFSLTGYSLVNVAVIIFREKSPELKRRFRVPFYPLTPILGIGINMFMVVQLMLTDILALIVSTFIVGIGLLYYYIGLPKLSTAPKGVTPQIIPVLRPNDMKLEKAKDEYRVVVPIGQPEHVKSLIDLGLKLAHGQKRAKVIPIHVVEVADAIPLDSTYDEFKEGMENYERIISEIRNLCDEQVVCTESQLYLSRDRSHAINKATEDEGANFTLIGWHHSGIAYNMTGGVVPDVLKSNKSTVGIYNPRGDGSVRKILYPYGGGIYSQAAANTVKRLAHAFNAEVTFLRILKEEVSEKDLEEMKNIMDESLKVMEVRGKSLIVYGTSVRRTVINISAEYDLIVLGIASEWGLKESITGFKNDDISEEAECSVLIVREYKKHLQNPRIRDLFNRLKRL